MSAWLATLACALAAGGENRLWWVEVELAGPCEALLLECGADGRARVAGPFLSGEERTLRVPVPVRSPLGVAGLASVPLPQVVLEPPGAAGHARVRGWSEDQPAERLGVPASPLGALPPSSAGTPRAGWAELAVVLCAGGFLLALRRRLVPAVLVALASSALVFQLARGRTAASRPEELVEWQAGAERALGVRAASERLALDCERLEVSPAGRALEFRLARDARTGEVLAPGARLLAQSRSPVPALARARNDWQPLVEVWTRSAAGDWRSRGSWDFGAALGPAGAGGDPPGWLTGALPPGGGILVARGASGVWLRCLGFEAE